MIQIIGLYISALLAPVFNNVIRNKKVPITALAGGALVSIDDVLKVIIDIFNNDIIAINILMQSTASNSININPKLITTICHETSTVNPDDISKGICTILVKKHSKDIALATQLETKAIILTKQRFYKIAGTSIIVAFVVVILIIILKKSQNRYQKG